MNDAQTVTHEEFYLSATRVEMDGFDVLTVHKALRTSIGDSWMRPVLDELAARCYTWVSAVARSDDMMMGGQAVELVYHVWHRCPGHRTPHECDRTVPETLIPRRWFS